MSENEIQGVKTAALLHDIGKLAVPEHILSKPGPLTQEEFQKIRIHPQVGAEIIAGVPFPYPVAPLILSHHERWDGKGYPAGMKGDEIPAGARILAVVDYFDALTSERPVSQGDERRRRRRAAAAGSRQSARPESGADVRREPRHASRRSRDHDRDGPHAGAADGHEREGTPGRRPAARAVEQDGVRRHRARASRDLRALRNRAGDGHQPRRRRHDGADLVEAEQPGALLVLRAVPAQRRARDAALPVRDRRSTPKSSSRSP